MKTEEELVNEGMEIGRLEMERNQVAKDQVQVTLRMDPATALEILECAISKITRLRSALCAMVGVDGREALEERKKAALHFNPVELIAIDALLATLPEEEPKDAEWKTAKFEMGKGVPPLMSVCSTCGHVKREEY